MWPDCHADGGEGRGERRLEPEMPEPCCPGDPAWAHQEGRGHPHAGTQPREVLPPAWMPTPLSSDEGECPHPGAPPRPPARTRGEQPDPKGPGPEMGMWGSVSTPAEKPCGRPCSPSVGSAVGRGDQGRPVEAQRHGVFVEMTSGAAAKPEDSPRTRFPPGTDGLHWPHSWEQVWPGAPRQHLPGWS